MTTVFEVGSLLRFVVTQAHTSQWSPGNKRICRYLQATRHIRDYVILTLKLNSVCLTIKCATTGLFLVLNYTKSKIL
jgi:hypothetical protein